MFDDYPETLMALSRKVVDAYPDNAQEIANLDAFIKAAHPVVVFKGMELRFAIYCDGGPKWQHRDMRELDKDEDWDVCRWECPVSRYDNDYPAELQRIINERGLRDAPK